MDTVLWAAQIILGIKLLTVSFTHGPGQSGTTMQVAIKKLGGFSRPLLYTVAFATFIATLGLILPGVLGLPASITPVTAALVAVMLLISIYFHVRAREQPKIFVSVVLFVFAAFIAYGRWNLAP